MHELDPSLSPGNINPDISDGVENESKEMETLIEFVHSSGEISQLDFDNAMKRAHLALVKYKASLAADYSGKLERFTDGSMASMFLVSTQNAKGSPNDRDQCQTQPAEATDLEAIKTSTGDMQINFKVAGRYHVALPMESRVFMNINMKHPVGDAYELFYNCETGLVFVLSVHVTSPEEVCRLMSEYESKSTRLESTDTNDPCVCCQDLLATEGVFCDMCGDFICHDCLWGRREVDTADINVADIKVKCVHCGDKCTNNAIHIIRHPKSGASTTVVVSESHVFEYELSNDTTMLASATPDNIADVCMLYGHVENADKAMMKAVGTLNEWYELTNASNLKSFKLTETTNNQYDSYTTVLRLANDPKAPNILFSNRAERWTISSNYEQLDWDNVYASIGDAESSTFHKISPYDGEPVRLLMCATYLPYNLDSIVRSLIPDNISLEVIRDAEAYCFGMIEIKWSPEDVKYEDVLKFLAEFTRVLFDTSIVAMIVRVLLCWIERSTDENPNTSFDVFCDPTELTSWSALQKSGQLDSFRRIIQYWEDDRYRQVYEKMRCFTLFLELVQPMLEQLVESQWNGKIASVPVDKELRTLIAGFERIRNELESDL
jgi:hypothetical protein